MFELYYNMTTIDQMSAVVVTVCSYWNDHKFLIIGVQASLVREHSFVLCGCTFCPGKNVVSLGLKFLSMN